MKKPEFPRATNVVTLRCNLNCRLCVIGSPYYQIPWHPTLEYVNTVTDRLFEIADFQIFDLTGGEPLLRKDLPYILDHLLTYKSHISVRSGFQSNGSIPITDDLVYAAKQFNGKFKIIMDDYGPDLSRYAQNNYEILKEADVPVELRHQHAGNEYCSGWVDYIGDGTIRHSEEDAQKLFSMCAQPQIMGFCAVAVEGCILPCPIMYTLKKIHHIDSMEWEYIDLFDQSESMEKKREKWCNIYQLNGLHVCKFCSGICSDSLRFTPALQLTADDIKELKKV